MTIPSVLAQRLNSALESLGDEIPADFIGEVTMATDTRNGDYQTNAAMVLANQFRSNPRDLAARIVEALDVEGVCEDPVISGPGFINFRILGSALSTRIEELLNDDRLGLAPPEKPLTIVIDFSSPNVAKPMHVGHIRSTFIGDTLARIARFYGHTVITDNHIGDWGTQFGMIIYGWKNRVNKEALEADATSELVRVYKEVNAEAKQNTDLMAECRDELVKLQSGDKENTAIWQECVDLSLAQLREVYARLDIHFDHYLGESHYNEALAPLVEDLLEKEIARESEGAICVFFEEIKALAEKPCLIRKSDGGFNYATTDLATIDYRLNELKADEVWYVVGAPQALHFDQVFETAKRRGVSAKLIHIPHGSILGSDGKLMRTRSGESVGLDDVLTAAVHGMEDTEDQKAVKGARSIVDEKNPDLPEEEKVKVAEAVGIGAVKYAELSQFRMTDYKFSYEKILALKGNTAPYLQYSYVRTRAIFRKLGETPELSGEMRIEAPEERELLLRIVQFPEVFPEVLADHRPNVLANYLFETARAFHSFFEACNVLRAEGATRTTRLALCELTSRVLKEGLNLLGIRVVERM